MLRAHRAILRVELTWRLLTPLLAVALVLSAGIAAPEPVEAGGTSTIAIYRQRQLASETAMRRADKQIERLQKQRKNRARSLRSAKKRLAKAIARRKAADRRADAAGARLTNLELTLARETRVRPNPAGTQKVDKPKLRKRIEQLKKQVRQLEKKARRASKKEAKVRKLKQSRMSRPTQARFDARRNERERSEDKLSAAIYAMTELSKDRAGRFGTGSVARFTRPAGGRISQRYGCTGYPTNPSRGSCKHFHDGIDIVAPKGSKVKVAADGFVAYVGWSPWDDRKRSYVVIVAHARGYTTVYGHLQPTRLVRAGQKVKRGAVIGRVGMTGLTTGPHVHWEIHKGGATLNPLSAGG
jgi:murein DD-endopeptidase MepM/ murein hydrolase activator NlpD